MLALAIDLSKLRENFLLTFSDSSVIPLEPVTPRKMAYGARNGLAAMY